MYFLSDTIAEGMKSAKTTRRRISATRQNTKKKSVRKQQKRHNHHSRKRTRRHRRQRGGDYSIPTTHTYENTPVTDTAVISIPGKPIVSVKDENKKSTEEELGLPPGDI
jgi:hypothetical protein